MTGTEGARVSGNELTPEMKQYREALIMALRLRDVPGHRIGEIVAEVESHAAETGEDPVAAFGPAREYAEQFPRGRSPWSFRGFVSIALSLCGSIFFVEGVSELRSGDGFYGTALPGWIGIPAGILLAGLVLPLIPRQDREPVVDPRTGKDLAAIPRWVGPLVVGVIVASLALLRWLL